jgi:hypothetical protein
MEFEKAMKVVREKGLENNIDIQFNKNKTKLPFDDNSFDIVYGAWLPHELTTNEEFLDEIYRVARKSVLLVMPGIDDVLVAMKSIVLPGEKERRLGYRGKIKGYLEGMGMEDSFKDARLRLDFDNFKDIKGVFDAFEFSRGYDGKEYKVEIFLRERIHNMDNSFYCIIGEK